MQEAAAKIIAPKGFLVKPASLSKIPNNHDFSVEQRKPLLVTNKNIPFMIMENSTNDRATINIDGERYNTPLGEKITISNTDCTLWLYSIKDYTYSFQMKCI